MATLQDLLDLLPDNTTGAISAADVRFIITTLWEADQTEMAARLAAQAAALSFPFGYIELVTDPPVVPEDEGIVSWNPTESTLNIQTHFPGVVIQAGQELVARVRNNSGADIPNGTPVYVSGAQGDRPNIAPAAAGVELQENRTLGMTTGDIARNTEGVVTLVGIVNDLDTSAYEVGDLLYLDTTPGSMSTTKTRTFIGMVLRKHNNQGKIGVRVVPPPQVDELASALIADETSLIRAALDQYLTDKGLI